ncbi:MAG: bifunctional diaminohydroxyphosphoribosylaminopyrimidine deaminase/5-amino-6-(5-phosphoribosylamino)uracil reductase RibD [Planctomycetota bacterium]
MRRALEFARRGIGFVEPNPAVGAIIVADGGGVVGEGWHERFGGPHAEVMALAAAGEAARGATLVVTLEPCCHFGKTPPCTRAVIAAGIRHVVVAVVDPAAHVNGGGIAELRAAGIEVEVGLLADDARRLIAPFAKLATTGLPWVHAKWAMTLDGKIASKTGSSRWITNESSRAVVHQLRGRMDAIIVGIGTVHADDPLLTARPPGPRTPIRIVLDSTARTPLESQLVRTARDVRTVVIVTRHAPEDRCAALQAAGAEVLVVAEDSTGHSDLGTVLGELGRQRLTNVLVEGGGRVLGRFFDAAAIDEVHAFIAPKLIGGAAAPSPLAGQGLAEMSVALRLDPSTVEVLDGDIYLHGWTTRSG